jgi:hypothetical protein
MRVLRVPLMFQPIAVAPFLLALGCILVLSGCAVPAAQPTATATPDLEIWSPEDRIMPAALPCDRISENNWGLTWNDLTIGASGFEDVDEKFLGASQNNITPSHVAWRSDGISADWHSVEACFIDGKLSALNIFGTTRFLELNNPEFIPDLDGWIAEFGQPDQVTWAYDYYLRTITWIEHGLLIVVSATPSPGYPIGVVNFILFPPFPADQFEDSWLAHSLPVANQEYSGDVTNLPDVEDLWHITK